MGLFDKIKGDIQKSGTNRGKFLYLKEGDKIRVRFLTDMEDGLEVVFHDSYALGVNVPCQEAFGRECKYCEDQDLRTRSQYVWSVYDYEAEEVKLLMAPVNQCSPVPQIAAVYESYGTLTDRDYEIKRQGKGQNTTYTVLPLEKKVFRNKKVKPLSEQSILKIIDKAYPDEETDYTDEDEEETKTKTKKKPETKQRSKMSKYVNVPEEVGEDDWGEEEEQENDYESMKPVDLYKLCKERDISCKPKKSKEYYIDLLTEADEEDSEDEDDWGDDDE
mgnify:CR=1 FL=1